ncbi:MAG: glycosyltransferase 87 family protein [Vicinamibacterales bacterium]
MSSANTGRGSWLIYGAPLAVAVVLNLLLFVGSHEHTTVDSADYLAQAHALVSDGAANNAKGLPDTVRTPGYPLFLAVFFAAQLGIRAAVAVQHVIWIALTLATVLVCWRWSGHRVAAVAAGFVMAVDLPGVEAANLVLTETVSAALLLGVAWQVATLAGAEDNKVIARSIAAGVLIGVTALVRPIAALLGVPIALAIFLIASRRWRAVAATATLIASLVLPAIWTARNYRATGVATFSSISAINLLLFRAAGTLAIRDPGGLDANFPARRRQLEALACDDAVAEYGRPCAEISTTLLAARYSRLAIPIILHDPWAYTLVSARALVMIVLGGGATTLARAIQVSEGTARLLCLAYTVPLALSAIAGLGFWWRRNRGVFWLLSLPVFYMIVTALGPEAYSRFRVPVLPLYAMLSGGGVALAWERLRPGLNKPATARI